MELKRKEQKLKGCASLRDSYNYYKEHSENPITYKLYSQYIKECNLELLNQVVNESNEVELPYRMGKLHIIKNTRSYGHSKSNWAVDYKRSKQEGFIIYHDQKYIYSWRWNLRNAIVINKGKYKFQAMRKAKRMVAPALRAGQDFFKLK